MECLGAFVAGPAQLPAPPPRSAWQGGVGSKVQIRIKPKKFRDFLAGLVEEMREEGRFRLDTRKNFLMLRMVRCGHSLDYLIVS